MAGDWVVVYSFAFVAPHMYWTTCCGPPVMPRLPHWPCAQDSTDDQSYGVCELLL